MDDMRDGEAPLNVPRVELEQLLAVAACRGKVMIVRYADDIVAGFQYEDDAKRFLAAMRERLAKFVLTLHPEKTRLIEFGVYAAERRAKRGQGKPETFTFLGFTHICGQRRAGGFLLHRRSRRDRMRATLREVRDGLRRRWHAPIWAGRRLWPRGRVSGLAR
jgi:RNA-directed DNA polymerase